MECPTCNKKPTDRDKVLNCDICGRQFHALCQDFTSTELTLLQKKLNKLRWYCPNCEYGAVKLHHEMITLNSKMKKMEEKLEEIDTRTKDADANMAAKVDEMISIKKTELVTDIKLEVHQEMEKEAKELLDDTKILEKCKEEVSNSIQDELNKPEMVNKLTKEMADRERRRNNIIVHGFAESKDENAETRLKNDQAMSLKLLKFLNNDLQESSIKKVMRLGPFRESRTRALLIELHEAKDKESVLSATKKLRGSEFDKIGISHDLTNCQRKELQGMVEEAKTRSNGDKIYKVVGPPSFWKIQEKTVPK